MLRIALVGAFAYPARQGSQAFLRETAKALHDIGHDVHVVVYGHGEDNGATDGYSIHRCMRLPGDTRTQAGPHLAKPFLDAALLLKLRRVIREQHIDVVVAHNYEALAAALCAGKRPIIYQAHNALQDELPYYFHGSAIARRFGEWLDQRLPRRADCVVVPHRRLAAYLALCGCDPKRLRIVPPPVEAPAQRPPVPAAALAPVVYTGNLDPYQNLPLLLRAMALVRAVHPEARLIIGTHLNTSVENAEVVRIKDTAALSSLLAQDVVVAVPRVSWSGYPIKLLNAMAAGRAVVACAGAAHPIRDGVNGRVIPDNDDRAFATALLQLMTNHKLRSDLGVAARQTVLTRHHPNSIALELAELAGATLKRREAG